MSEALHIVQLLAGSDLAALIADFISASVSLVKLPDIRKRSVSDISKSFPGKECLVRCYDYIRHGDKPCQDIVINDMVGIVVEEDIRLFLIHIKARSSDLTVLNALQECLRIDQSAS